MTKTKIAILLTLLLCGTSYAKDVGLDGSGATPITAASTTIAGRMLSLTLIFSTDFVGTVAGTCVAGTAGVCGANFPATATLSVPVGVGNTLTSTIVTRSAGSFEYLRTQ